MNSRILVITGSNDTAAQYINYMNVFFTAQVYTFLFIPCFILMIWLYNKKFHVIIETTSTD